MEAAVGILRTSWSPILALFGVIGNTITVAVFSIEARLSRSWNRFGVYCVALAVSDSCVLVTNTLMDDFLGRGLLFATSGRLTVKLDTYSNITCRLMELLPNASYFASAYLLLALSADRMAVIWRPMACASNRHTLGTALLCVVVCAAGILLSLPTALVLTVDASAQGVQGQKCDVDRTNTSDEKLICFTLYFKTFGIFVIPMLVQSAASVVILVKLISIGQKRAELLAGGVSNNGELDRFRALLTLSIARCLLTLPLCVLIVLRTSCDTRNMVPPGSDPVFLGHLSRFVDSIKDANYAIGFWIYFVCVPQFRRRCLLAGAFACVRLQCVRICPRLPPARRAIQMVEELERKRRPATVVSRSTRSEAKPAAVSESVDVGIADREGRVRGEPTAGGGTGEENRF